MSKPSDFPYTTDLNILFPPLSLIDIANVVSQVEAGWFNQTLCKVNDSVIRLGVMQGSITGTSTTTSSSLSWRAVLSSTLRVNP
jgi:hypothetical protein